MSMSVDNLYWVLYENLLKPAGMDSKFQYPFGSGQILLSPFEIDRTAKAKSIFNNFRRHHAFLHFDQEPIYENNEIDIINGTDGNYHKHLRLLANSEYSDIKKTFCQKHQLLDWYYFYHGFAALDWYRDAEYVSHDRGIIDAFSSFNHIVRHKRSYRMSLTARLLERNLLDYGTISFHGDFQDCVAEVSDPYTEVSSTSQTLIKQNLIGTQIQRLIVDSDDVDGTFSAKFGGNMYRLRQRSFLHLVNETVFYDRKLHLTEKTFHPIVHMRPFMLVAAPGNLAYLKSYGFKTFGDWIDESYDSIEDNDLRLDHIANETERIASKSIDELNKILDQMRPVLEFNKRHFFGEFRNRIANELVDNFETCLRIWNNGRVDDRAVKMLSREQLDSVKRILGR